MLLDAYMYNLETIDPRDRWEQGQLYEFQGFVVLEHLQLLSDETEQQENIDAEERFTQANQEERSDHDLLQMEQSEHIDFLLLQLNQPLSYEQWLFISSISCISSVKNCIPDHLLCETHIFHSKNALLF